MQNELTQTGKLLDSRGRLAQVGWSRQPVLDCNLEDAHFYTFKPFQRFRIKRWDYYALFTPQRFFSATIADLGYAGNIFVYVFDFASSELHEEGLVVPMGKGITLPRNSDQGESIFEDKRAQLKFEVVPAGRHIHVEWPSFNQGRGIAADILFHQPPAHESMTIVIPIGEQRFYYNRKINCLTAEGQLQYGEEIEQLSPTRCIGSLDWGRGVWEYESFWNWASASGFLPDGRTVGLNLGCGFGDLSAATENCLVLDRKIHKLEAVKFIYDSHDFMRPWKFTDSDQHLDLDFVPFKERVAITNLGIIFSEVHQMLGKYSGEVRADDGSILTLENLIGFAEQHQARW
ncbi:MAG TPA: DUF2804 domain-containing protein [Anaerolineales bacterium]|nr:DUF2804 domain-containing protein [Anaerolineales bacterium]